jgi:hypothetical protein
MQLKNREWTRIDANSEAAEQRFPAKSPFTVWCGPMFVVRALVFVRVDSRPFAVQKDRSGLAVSMQ